MAVLPLIQSCGLKPSCKSGIDIDDGSLSERPFLTLLLELEWKEDRRLEYDHGG